MNRLLPDPRPYFADLDDPRRETKNKLHKLNDILMIVFCCVLSGIDDWVGMEDFAVEKETWFRRFLELPNGVPSHATLSNVIGRLKPGAFAEAFLAWVRAALPSLSDEQVCVDGKTLRGSRSDGTAVHLVSAYAAKARWVLTQKAVADKANEIVAIPDVLSMLELKGAVVTRDAMGCQKAIARQIVEAGADYVRALKATIRPCARWCACGWTRKRRRGPWPRRRPWRRATGASRRGATVSAATSTGWGQNPSGRG